MPGLWRVPVSSQSHALAPPGKSLTSLKEPSPPATSRRPQEWWVTLGERASCCILSPPTSVTLAGFTGQGSGYHRGGSRGPSPAREPPDLAGWGRAAGPLDLRHAEARA